MLKSISSYVLASAAGVAVAFMLSGIFMVTEVTGTAMEPELQEGSYVLVDKHAYTRASAVPDTGDVVAVRNHIYTEDGEGSIIIRRVAGKPGDVIEIKNDILYVNDRPFTDHMAEPAHMDDIAEYVLGDDEVFLMSDDRRSGTDSRNEAIGTVELSSCLGKVCFK